MTTLGILAGSGIMRIDLTLLAATLGAIAGDGLSYLLGSIYSEKLGTIWPFSKYPTWLAFGKDYFSRHGGKSVLIGRFVGPLRSIIPVIAGMMHMSHWRFFIANVISAIGWSCLYVLPGVAIGAAGSELSAESATRLFVFIVILLVCIWLLGTGIKKLSIVINRHLHAHLHSVWTRSVKNRNLFRWLTPVHETQYYQTALMFFGFLLAVLLFVILSVLVYTESVSLFNQPVYLFLQSLRTSGFDAFFIITGELTGVIALCCTTVIILLLALSARNWRASYYWAFLNISTITLLVLTHSFINSSPPDGLLEVQPESSYPMIQLCIASAQFTAILFYLNHCCECVFKRLLNIGLPGILVLIGIGSIYLGDSWLSDILGAWLSGFAIGLFYWMLYRRSNLEKNHTCILLALIPLLIICGLISLYFNYDQSLKAHKPWQAQYMLTETAWWDQKKPVLPLYRSNRIGHRIGVLNIQYVGNLGHFQHALAAFGWRVQKASLFETVLKRINSFQNTDTPIMSQLYLNRKPVLTMMYYNESGEPLHVLRIWRSNYHVKNVPQPIWLGSVNPYRLLKDNNHGAGKTSQPSLSFVSEALKQFNQRTLNITVHMPANSRYEYQPKLLLISEPDAEASNWTEYIHFPTI